MPCCRCGTRNVEHSDDEESISERGQLSKKTLVQAASRHDSRMSRLFRRRKPPVPLKSPSARRLRRQMSSDRHYSPSKFGGITTQSTSSPANSSALTQTTCSVDEPISPRDEYVPKPKLHRLVLQKGVSTESERRGKNLEMLQPDGINLTRKKTARFQEIVEVVEIQDIKKTGQITSMTRYNVSLEAQVVNRSPVVISEVKGRRPSSFPEDSPPRAPLKRRRSMPDEPDVSQFSPGRRVQSAAQLRKMVERRWLIDNGISPRPISPRQFSPRQQEPSMTPRPSSPR